MSKGLDMMLDRIKAQPSSMLVSRYLSLIAELPDEAQKTQRALDLAQVLVEQKPVEALRIAHMVHKGDTGNVRALDLMIAALEARGRYAKAEVLRNERAKLAGSPALPPLPGSPRGDAAWGGLPAGRGRFDELSLSRESASADESGARPTVKLDDGLPGPSSRLAQPTEPSMPHGFAAAGEGTGADSADRLLDHLFPRDAAAAEGGDPLPGFAPSVAPGDTVLPFGRGPDGRKVEAVPGSGYPGVTAHRSLARAKEKVGAGAVQAPAVDPAAAAGHGAAPAPVSAGYRPAHAPAGHYAAHAPAGHHAAHALSGHHPAHAPTSAGYRPTSAPQPASQYAPGAPFQQAAPVPQAVSAPQAAHAWAAGAAAHQGPQAAHAWAAAVAAQPTGASYRPTVPGHPNPFTLGSDAPTDLLHAHAVPASQAQAPFAGAAHAAPQNHLAHDHAANPAFPSAAPQPAFVTPAPPAAAPPPSAAAPSLGTPFPTHALPPPPPPGTVGGFGVVVDLVDRYLRQGFLAEARELLQQTEAICGHESWWRSRQAILHAAGNNTTLPLASRAVVTPSAAAAVELPPPPPVRGEDFWRPLQSELGRLARSAKSLLVPVSRVERLKTLLAHGKGGTRLPDDFIRALAELDHRLPGVDAERLLQLKWDLVQGLFGSHPDLACALVLEDLGLARASTGFWGLYLDSLLNGGNARRALVEIRRGLAAQPHLPWARIAWKRLPLVWSLLRVHGFQWTEDDGVPALKARLATRPRPRLSSLVVARTAK